MNFPEEPIHLKESKATILATVEYDRLLNIEGEHAKICREHGEMLALLEDIADDGCEWTYALQRHDCRATGAMCKVCRARALIARMKGEK